MNIKEIMTGSTDQLQQGEIALINWIASILFILCSVIDGV